MGIFDVTTTITLENVVKVNDTTTVVPEAGVITVSGSLTGFPTRDVELSADAVSSLGYAFKEWVIETFPIELKEVGTSRPYSTIQEICGPDLNNSQVSEAYFTDGIFLYEDREGTKPAPEGYYGAGSSDYYFHSTSLGLSGPFVCGQTQTGGGNNTGGGSTEEVTKINQE